VHEFGAAQLQLWAGLAGCMAGPAKSSRSLKKSKILVTQVIVVVAGDSARMGSSCCSKFPRRE
jgi:hypothetical protein